MPCKCRNCGKTYSEAKATADWKGYCTQRCVHAKAKALGYRKENSSGITEYSVLKRANAVGSVPEEPK